jgi:hypothetical protein
MHIAIKRFPSPLTGEGAGGGEDNTSSPPSPPSPARGEGVFPSLCQAAREEGKCRQERGHAYPCSPCCAKSGCGFLSRARYVVRGRVFRSVSSP